MSVVDRVRQPTGASPALPAGGPHRGRSLFDREILAYAAVDAFRKLDPRVQVQQSR